jgi:hypothetical protein
MACIVDATMIFRSITPHLHGLHRAILGPGWPLDATGASLYIYSF